MKDYDAFKSTLTKAASVVAERKGTPVILYGWRKESPFQKARYRSEYVFPEVWTKRPGTRGAVITGEDVHSVDDAVRLIADYLY